MKTPASRFLRSLGPLLGIGMLAFAACDRTPAPGAASASGGATGAPSGAEVAELTVAPTPGGPEASVRTVILRYEIDGMHCKGCSGAIVAKVAQISGVRRAEADHQHARGEVEVTDEALDSEIRAAVERLGYTIRRVPTQTPEASEAPRADG